MFSVLQLAVWALGATAELLAFAAAVRSRLYSIVPAFSAYLCWQVVKNIPGIAALFLHDAALYAAIYWTFESVAWLLLFFVIAELAHVELRDYPATVRMARNAVTYFAGVFLATIAFVWVSAKASQGPCDWLNYWLLLMAGSAYWLQVGVLLGLVVFLQILRVPTSFLFRCVSGGLLVNGVVRFVTSWMRNELGTGGTYWTGLARSVAFAGIMFFWWWAIRSRERFEERVSPLQALPEREGTLVLERLARLNNRLQVT